ncbi:MAG: SOS response-associated peptidase [Oscillospiraceae bacterium]|nr:SOS response-associated peptidase [Oscillospiraceae bacterium]
MCCRYYILPRGVEWDPIREGVERSALTARFREAGIPLRPEGEIRPTDAAPVLAADRRGGSRVFPMRWGFSLSGRAPLINARVETAAEKPSFREAWAAHRCAVPASWYFEWRHSAAPDSGKLRKTKYAVRPLGAEPLWLCGLYRMENGLPAFVILTREPGPELAFLHDRMPLILPGEAVSDWIRPDADPRALLPRALTALRAEPAG